MFKKIANKKMWVVQHISFIAKKNAGQPHYSTYKHV